MCNKPLALGTAQFGGAYGIANRTGQVDVREIAQILERAWEAGLRTLDTAAAYGDSESRLGWIGVKDWRIVSKLPPSSLPEESGVEGWALNTLRGSLRRLGVPRLYGWLVHRASQLLEPQGPALFEAMQFAKRNGWVEKIGVSVYGPSDLEALCARYCFDLVQAPFNILDRRLVTSGWLKKLQETGVEVHVRSVFLQGLLLMRAEDRPPAFRRWQSIWDQWHRWLQDSRQSAVVACLGYALAHTAADCVVIGVDNLAQLEELLLAVRAESEPPPHDLKSDDLDLINPSRWVAI